MDINAFSAAKAYGAAQQALNPGAKKQSVTPGETGEGFHPEKILEGLSSAVANGENTASAFMAGKADPHSVVEALASAELAVETAVTLRNKVVEAYQELMRMPV